VKERKRNNNTRSQRALIFSFVLIGSSTPANHILRCIEQRLSPLLAMVAQFTVHRMMRDSGTVVALLGDLVHTPGHQR